MPKQKILFYISSLKSGGAERVLTHIANYWSEKGRDISIVTVILGESDFELDVKIRTIGQETYNISTNFFEGLYANIRRIRHLRRTIKEIKPDIIISFTTMCNIVAYFAKVGLSVPLVISERTNPSAYPLNFVWQQLRAFTYNRASALVLQTKGVQKLYQNYSPPQYVVRNPLILPKFVLPIQSYSPKIIITIGRLDREKNVQMLVHAFAKTNQRDWSLWIIGRDAGQQYLIEEAIKTLGLSDRVQLLGNQTDVFRYLSKASIFAMTTKVEGYPNALLEAMAIGLPVVSTDCDFGPSEMIVNGENGYLVPLNDVDSFAEKLRFLMLDEGLRRKMGQKAREIQKSHSLSDVMADWDTLVKSL